MPLKTIVSGLLLFTGVFHLYVAFFASNADLTTPLALFGILYMGLGAWTWNGGRSSVLSAVFTCGLGLGLGGVSYLQNGGPWTLPAMFAIDIVIIIAGGLWLKANKA